MSINLLQRAALLFACVTAGLAVACGQAAAGPYDSPGGRLYLKNCATCHGGNGQGAIGPPLGATGQAQRRSDADLAAFITEGIRNPGKPEMPGWRGRMTDQEIADVIGFIKGMWTDAQRSEQKALGGG